jgi:hypothetical protein
MVQTQKSGENPMGSSHLEVARKAKQLAIQSFANRYTPPCLDWFITSIGYARIFTETSYGSITRPA